MKNSQIAKSIVLFLSFYLFIAPLSPVISIVQAEQQDHKVKVCHITNRQTGQPNNKENSKTLTISKNALDAHLAHGDILGECHFSSSINLSIDIKEEPLLGADAMVYLNVKNIGEEVGEHATVELELPHGVTFKEAISPIYSPIDPIYPSYISNNLVRWDSLNNLSSGESYRLAFKLNIGDNPDVFIGDTIKLVARASFSNFPDDIEEQSILTTVQGFRLLYIPINHELVTGTEKYSKTQKISVQSNPAQDSNGEAVTITETLSSGIQYTSNSQSIQNASNLLSFDYNKNNNELSWLVNTLTIDNFQNPVIASYDISIPYTDLNNKVIEHNSIHKIETEVEAGYKTKTESSKGFKLEDSTNIQAKYVQISKWVDKRQVNPGDEVKFSVRINTSEYYNFTNARIVDTLPDGFTFKSATESLSSNPSIQPDGTTILEWNLSNLTANSTHEFEYTTVVNQRYTKTNADLLSNDYFINKIEFIGDFDDINSSRTGEISDTDTSTNQTFRPEIETLVFNKFENTWTKQVHSKPGAIVSFKTTVNFPEHVPTDNVIFENFIPPFTTILKDTIGVSYAGIIENTPITYTDIESTMSKGFRFDIGRVEENATLTLQYQVQIENTEDLYHETALRSISKLSYTNTKGDNKLEMDKASILLGVNIDMLKPIGTIKFNKIDDETQLLEENIKYTNELINLKVTYSAFDVAQDDVNPSGIKSIRTSRDGYNWTIQNSNWNGSSFSLDINPEQISEGRNFFFAEITDNEGNIAIVKGNFIYDITSPNENSGNIKIGTKYSDLTNPSRTDSFLNFVTYIAEDNLTPQTTPEYTLSKVDVSGVGFVRFSIDDEIYTDWESYTDGHLNSFEEEWSSAYLRDGKLLAYMQIKDRAGNIGTTTFGDDIYMNNIGVLQSFASMDSRMMMSPLASSCMQDGFVRLSNENFDQNNPSSIHFESTTVHNKDWGMYKSLDTQKTRENFQKPVIKSVQLVGDKYIIKGIANPTSQPVKVKVRNLEDTFDCSSGCETDYYEYREFDTNLNFARVNLWKDKSQGDFLWYTDSISNNGEWQIEVSKDRLTQSDTIEIDFEIDNSLYENSHFELPKNYNWIGNDLNTTTVKLSITNENNNENLEIYGDTITIPAICSNNQETLEEQCDEYSTTHGMLDVCRLNEKNTFYDNISNLINNNVVDGYSDGNFRPSNPVSRGAMAKFIKNAFNVPTNTDCGDFPDVPKDHTFYTEITSLKCDGIIEGYSDGNYNPDSEVTRGAVAKFIVNAKDIPINTSCDPFPDVDENNVFYDYVTTLKCEGISDGYSDGKYKPETTISRGAMSKLIDLAMGWKEFSLTDTFYVEKTNFDTKTECYAVDESIVCQEVPEFPTYPNSIHTDTDENKRKLNFEVIKGNQYKHDPNKEVWIVIHGWAPDSGAEQDYEYWRTHGFGSIGEIKNKLTPFIGDAEILFLNWKDASVAKGNVTKATPWIRPTAKEAAKILQKWGITDGTQVNFIGHSLGTLMDREIAKELGGAKRLIALDPPREGWLLLKYDVDGNTNALQRPDYNDYYKSQFQFSRAYVGESSAAGNPDLAGTALESYLVDFHGELDGGEEHNWVVEAYKNMLEDGRIIQSNAPNKTKTLLTLLDTGLVDSKYVLQNQFQHFNIRHEGMIEISNYADKDDDDFVPHIGSLVAKSEGQKYVCNADDFVVYGTITSDTIMQRSKCSEIYAGNGDDTIKMKGNRSKYIRGGMGGDTILTNYNILGGTTTNMVYGEGGEDTFDLWAYGGEELFSNKNFIKIQDFEGDKINLSGVPNQYKIADNNGKVELYRNNYLIALVEGDGVDYITFERDLENLRKNEATEIFFIN